MAGRRINVDDLVTSREITERLGLAKPATVHNWARRHPDFPRPVIAKERLALWVWPDVLAWARNTGRYPKP